MLGSAIPATAAVPDPDRTLTAIARVNKSSGRDQAFQLELTMRVGGRSPIARGDLISHPSGLARLELRGSNGRIDRYVLSGSELSGVSDGVFLDQPQPLLQPLFFLQPGSGATLRAALDAFGVDSQSVGVSDCGEQDCFVIGDPRLASGASLADVNERIEADREARAALERLQSEQGEGSRLAKEIGDLLKMRNRASSVSGVEGGLARLIDPSERLDRLWVDVKDLQVRRIDRSDGVFTVFGPPISHDRLLFPAWFEIHEPGAEPIRFEIERAVRVNAPAKVFGRDWLVGPETPAAAPGR